MALVLFLLTLGTTPQVVATFPTPQIGTQQDRNASTPNFNPPTPWWDDAGIATWVLVLVGIVASIIAVRTLADLREQTDATFIAATAAQDNATVARLNATALINSERAWVDGELMALSDGLYAPKFVNHGRTPAEMLSWHYTVKIFDHKVDPPVDTIAMDAIKNMGTLLRADGSFTERAPWVIDLINYMNRDKMEVGLETARIDIEIKYRDVVTPNREQHKTTMTYQFTQNHLERLVQLNDYT